MHIPILVDLVIIVSLSLPVLFICHRLGIPSIVGFLLTGTVVGPGGFGLISAIGEVNVLAEIGVVLLLFTIGIEFSLKNLLRIRRTVLLGGFLQVALTIGGALTIARAVGIDLRAATFFGMLVSLSSTAIVLRVLQERSEIDTSHGGASLGILIFQDIAVVPMMIATPLLAGITEPTAASLLVLGAKVVGALAVIYVGARWVVPYGLYQVARTRSNELFLLTVVFLALATAWFTAEIGLSLALGAFLAGLIVSESEYSHRALGSIASFKDVLTSFFFVSIGLLVDPQVLLQWPLLVGGLALAVLVLKLLTGTAAATMLGMPFHQSIAIGLVLCQLGEFSFILSRAGADAGLFPGSAYQVFLAVSILTMLAAPYVIGNAEAIGRMAERLPVPAAIRRGFRVQRPTDHASGLSDHLIVVGFGLSGRNVARAAAEAVIPYEIIELNPDTVLAERKNGEQIHYGDATQENVLLYAGLDRARTLVVTTPEAASTRRVVELARRLNSHVHIVARTRYVREIEALLDLGANEVVPEEYQTSVEIFSRVLRTYLVPQNDIDRFVAEIRSDGYGMLRTQARPPLQESELARHLRGVEVATLQVVGGAAYAGRTLSDTALRREYQVTAIGIKRGDGPLTIPDGDTELRPGDLVIVAGHPERVAEIAPLFCEQCDPDV